MALKELARGRRAAREVARALRAAIEKVIEKSRALEQLSELENRIDSVFGRAPAPSARAPAPTPPAASPEESEDIDLGPASAEEAENPGDLDADTDPIPPRAERSTAASGRARMIEVSPALEEFLKKIEAFVALVERGDMARAAVVAEDLRKAIESFDPRVYLPKLLAPYFRLLALRVEDLEPHW